MAKKGAGQSAKICNNMLLATTMIAVGESFKLEKDLGLDLNKLYDVFLLQVVHVGPLMHIVQSKELGQIPSDKDYEW